MNVMIIKKKYNFKKLQRIYIKKINTYIIELYNVEFKN